MKQLKVITYSTLIVAVAFTMSCKSNKSGKKDNLKPSKVELKHTNGQYRLYVDGTPFFVKGAGCEFGNIERLAQHGANSFRTWRTENGQQSAKEVLDRAYNAGLKVLMGLEIARERRGFDYNDSVAVKKQLDYIKEEVVKYKDHPALLAWGIGNELNLRATNMKVWNAVNDISKMIHTVDANHPTTTMLAGISKHEIDYIKQHCTDIDFISIQMYGDIVNLQKSIEAAEWEGPYMVTEWGATGHWEVPLTKWDAPIEQTSSEKADAYRHRYEIIELDSKNCLGSYVFLWGQKQERTPTWYGMFTEKGYETETVDVMHFKWTGHWPENRTPRLEKIQLNNKSRHDNISLKPNEEFTAYVSVNDPDNDEIKIKWEILSESTDLKDGGDWEARPRTYYENYGKAQQQLKAPKQNGAYRLFVYAYDGKGHAATANIPFLIEK